MSTILENLKAVGDVSISLTKADGSVENIDIHNKVVNTGLHVLVSRLKDTTDAAMTHMELGTGTTLAAGGDLTLQSAISASRVSLTSTTVSGSTITYVASFPPLTGSGAVTEAGIFNASSGGTMLCRTVFPVVNKQDGDSMTVTWTITVS